MQNLSSYSFTFIGGKDNSYIFETDIKVVYEVKFKSSNYIFKEKSLYSQFTFEFTIEIFYNPTLKSPPLDTRISNTIAQIFIDFFKNEQNIIVYTCETNDTKEYARFRKFNHWFNSFNDGSFEKKDFSLADYGNDSVYYSSIITKSKNPFKQEILDEFEEIMKQYSK